MSSQWRSGVILALFPMVLMGLSSAQYDSADFGLECTVCDEAHSESSITCTWRNQPNETFSALFKLNKRAQGRCPTELTEWQTCNLTSQSSCQIPFHGCADPFHDTYYVMVNSSSMLFQSINFIKPDIVKPDPPENLLVSSVSSREMTVEWDMPRCAALLFMNYICAIQYVSLRDNITREKEIMVDMPNPQYVTLGSLVPHTRYLVRIQCRQVIGELWSEYSPFIEAQTNESAPAGGPVVRTPEVTWIDYRLGLRNMTLRWEPLDLEKWNSETLGGYLVNATDQRTYETTSYNITASDVDLYTLTIPNLMLSEYQLKIMAYNNKGLSPPRVLQLRDISKRPDQPRNVVAMVTTEGDVLLSWQPPAAIGGIWKYYVSWCELARDHGCAGDGNVTSVPGTQLTVTVQDNWLPYSRYRFIVKAATSAGKGEPSSTVYLYSVEGVPSSPPQNVTVQAETSRSLLVRWKPPPLQDRRGIITTYRVYYYVTPTVRGQQTPTAERNASVNITDDAQPVQFSLSGLEPFTLYSVRLSAVTSQGEGNKSPPTGARTSQAAPSDPPADVQINDIAVNNITLSWTPPSQPNGIIRYYIIKHGNDTMSDGNHTAFVLEGLEGNTNYVIQVQGCTAAETPCGPLSPVELVRTKVGAPGIVQNLVARFDPTNGDVSVSWTPPVLKNGRDISYIVSYGRKDLRNDNIAVTTTTQWTNDKLADTCSDGLELFFRVRARTRDPGTGEVFNGPVSTEYLSCDTRPGTSPSSKDIQGLRLALEAKVGIILAVLIACMVGLAALVPSLRKMYKSSRNDVPGPADFITDTNQGVYCYIPDGPQTLNNLHIVSEQTGKTPEILDDFSKLRVERQWSHDSAFGSDYGNNNVDFNVAEQKAHYSVGGSSSGYSNASDENAALQSDVSKAENLASDNQQNNFDDYSKLANVDSNFKDLKVNYVTKQDSKMVEGLKHRTSTHSSMDNLDTKTDCSKLAAERDYRKDLDVNYVSNTGTKGNKSERVPKSEQSSPKHADIPYIESPSPVKCKMFDPNEAPYVTNA
ncbi:phosphatidylinositol phosphatase PTPRQ-like isoform X2 [Branchiostoma floridae]|uniref:Phosphatidylinositol phosphatase PTPRQ-like isoform X2 n=1 Tax=Branchiostoma floridae TaxID=7739 RepID=A0A9J7MEP3_BRAFL|nr:phosphatidylinositol phosphatase PTPRQ-like isoform X2 [Branchiostoma floridae]